MIREKFVETRFGNICYLEAGEGKKTLVFLHGLNGAPMGLIYLAPVLDKIGYKTIAPYLPGHGKSFYLPENFTFSDEVLAIEEFITKLEIKKMVLFGNSFGGGLAWQVAINKQTLVEKLILMDPLLKSVKGLGVLRNSLALLTDYTTDHLFRFPAGGSQSFEKVLITRPSISGVPRRLQLIDSVKIGPAVRLNVPTLVLWGRHDSVIPYESERKVIEELPKKRIVLFDGGHFWYLRQQREYLEELKRFIKE